MYLVYCCCYIRYQSNRIRCNTRMDITWITTHYLVVAFADSGRPETQIHCCRVVWTEQASKWMMHTIGYCTSSGSLTAALCSSLPPATSLTPLRSAATPLPCRIKHRSAPTENAAADDVEFAAAPAVALLTQGPTPCKPAVARTRPL